MVNNFYFYIYDKDFGPLFIKFCSNFPFGVKLCINDHEWLKCQLDQRGITYETLDNGIQSCADPKRVQKIADSLDEQKVDVGPAMPAFFRLALTTVAVKSLLPNFPHNPLV